MPPGSKLRYDRRNDSYKKVYSTGCYVKGSRATVRRHGLAGACVNSDAPETVACCSHNFGPLYLHPVVSLCALFLLLSCAGAIMFAYHAG